MNLEATIAKRIAKTWMAVYDTTEQPRLAAMGDSALTLAYRRFKGPINDRPEAELAEIAALYAELLRRHIRRQAAADDTARHAWAQALAAGVWPNTTQPIPQVGTQVWRVFPGLFGMGLRVSGRVYQAKVGLRVRLDPGQPIAGAKTIDLSPAWKHIQ